MAIRMRIEASTVSVMRRGGWTVSGKETSATKRDRGYSLTVKANGAWTARKGDKSVSGTETHPAYAAMEANEVCWQDKLG